MSVYLYSGGERKIIMTRCNRRYLRKAVLVCKKQEGLATNQLITSRFQAILLCGFGILLVLAGPDTSHSSAHVSPTVPTQIKVDISRSERLADRNTVSLLSTMLASSWSVDTGYPNQFQRDLWSGLNLYSGSNIAKQQAITALTVDKPFFTLINDIPDTITLFTDPAVPGLAISFEFFRETMAATSHSVNVIPLDGSLKTDAFGRARFQLQASYGGQGSVWCKIKAGDADLLIDGVITNPRRRESCFVQSNDSFSDPNDTNNSASLFSGERTLCASDLVIAGRGFGYSFTRKYRSQASHLRAIASNDFAVDWAMSYSDDRLIPDEKNVIVFRDCLRTDTFIATQSGAFLAPREYFEQLQVNTQGDFELRSEGGMVKTYKSLHDARIPGRLISMRDRNRNVMRFIYDKPAGLSKFVLTIVVDTMGRNILYRYYSDDELNAGRRGRLKEIEDFRRDNSTAGRRVRFDYDEEGNLISATSPIVRGTPNGNDFPDGKTYRYSYNRSSDISTSLRDVDHQRLSHNLSAIEYPNETAIASGTKREMVSYGLDPADATSFDRVFTYSIGGMNATGIPAGGIINFAYEIVAHRPAILTQNDPVLKVSVTDRRGNLTEYTYSPFDTLLEKREFTGSLRRLEPNAFVTTWRYNPDKLPVKMTMPEGNRKELTFDERNADRFAHGNLIREVSVPDSVRAADQSALFTEAIFEPIYQQPAATTDSRGLDMSFVPPIPDPSGRPQRERYTTRYFYDYQEADSALVLPLLAAELRTTDAEVRMRLDAAGVELGLGDLNDDGDVSPHISGNIVRKVFPSVVLLPSSNQAAIEGGLLQSIVMLYRYNQFGQMTSTVDPEGNVNTYAYYPETDPDGDGSNSSTPADARSLNSSTGGYVKEEVKDTESNPIRNNRTNPLPANIRGSCCGLFTYDDVGIRTSMIDGRGIRSDYFINELNQVVQVTHTAAVPPSGGGNKTEPLALTAFAYRENMFYDFNNNLTLRQVEDRGNTSNTDGFIDHTYKYDILDNVVEMTEEVNVAETLITRYRYDPNGNRTLVIEPEGNATSMLYDKRDLLFQSKQGSLSATAETLGVPPGSFNPRGGSAATQTYNYNGNRRLIETVDAADTDGSSANNSSITGDGDSLIYSLDGFDRTTRIVDAVGSETILNYDPANNVIREARKGTVGGESPKQMTGVNNVLLSVTEYQPDELNRLFQQDSILFVSPGITTQRQSTLTDGPLTPGDGKVTTRHEYDRKSRRTFVVEDDLRTARTDYDGADRTLKITDARGNLIETAYDANNNIIERRETDVSDVSGIPNEVFLTTDFYDSLNRLQVEVNNLGHTIEYRYDSRNNVVAMSDANGPVTKTTIARRFYPAGAPTVNTTNTFGNVTLYSYDGKNRRTRQDIILTTSGRGDGKRIGADIFGVRAKPPKPNTAHGGGDGRITTRSEWDRNSLPSSQTDDNGNQTRYGYDNLNRRVFETKGICTNPRLADSCEPPTTTRYEYDQDSNLVRRTDENGSVLAYTYDAINRCTGCEVAPAPGVAGTTSVSFLYDGLSRPVFVSDNNEPGLTNDDSVITYAYDALSRIIEETQKIGTSPTKAISASWNADSQRTALIYPNGRAIEFGYDELARLKSVADRNASQSIAVYDYIGAERVLQRSHPINGTRMTHLSSASTVGIADTGFDGLRRQVQLRHLRADNSLIVGFKHAYDRMNNRLDEVKLHDAFNNEEYDYDSAYRLVSFKRPLAGTAGGIVPTQSKWKLDGMGNWQEVNGETRQHSSFNEIIKRKKNGGTTNLLYDHNGNQTDDDIFTYQWDAGNRLRAVTRKADSLLIATYAYDAEGRRIQKTTSNSGALNATVRFYLDGNKEIEERNASDVLLQQYIYGAYIDEPLVLDRNLDADNNAIGPSDQRLFFHQNALHSVFALTDRSGNTVESYQYDAYGRPAVFIPLSTQSSSSAVGNPFLFTGRRLDSEAGLYHYRKRYMNMDQGRFITRDPLGDEDGMGLYEYTKENPLNASDPFGMFQQPNCPTCGGGIWFLSPYEMLSDAVFRAELMSDDAVSYIKYSTSMYLFKKYFGRPRPPEVQEVLNNFTKIRDTFSHGDTIYEIDEWCDVGFGYYGYSIPGGENKISLCRKFWWMGDTKRASGLVHEMSHEVAFTEDHGPYGRTNAQLLARYFPNLARTNADNYRFFAEDVEGIGRVLASTSSCRKVYENGIVKCESTPPPSSTYTGPPLEMPPPSPPPSSPSFSGSSPSPSP
jgi:RHS repeat-associated protein